MFEGEDDQNDGEDADGLEYERLAGAGVGRGESAEEAPESPAEQGE